jgi:hypothetical protein
MVSTDTHPVFRHKENRIFDTRRPSCPPAQPSAPIRAFLELNITWVSKIDKIERLYEKEFLKILK